MRSLSTHLRTLAAATILAAWPLLSFAQGLPTNAQEGLRQTGNPAYGEASAVNPTQTVGHIIGLVLTFLGILFLLLTIYAGLLWMTSGGDETKVTKAKKIITNSTIGLAIVLGAYAITWFVTNQILDATTEAPLSPI